MASPCNNRCNHDTVATKTVHGDGNGDGKRDDSSNDNKRRQGVGGQNPMDFQSITLTTWSRCPCNLVLEYTIAVWRLREAARQAAGGAWSWTWGPHGTPPPPSQIIPTACRLDTSGNFTVGLGITKYSQIQDFSSEIGAICLHLSINLGLYICIEAVGRALND